MTSHDIAEQVALSFLGKPYYWGGDDPMRGFDCSGFVIEVLKSAGKLPRHGDWTAQGLFDLFHASHVQEPDRGRLVFWKASNGRIIHVEFCLTDTLSIGASGGGKSTDSVQDAIHRNAYVKIRPFRTRTTIAGFVDPWG